MDEYASNRESMFEKLGIDEESLTKRGLSPDDVKAGILMIATRRASLLGREAVYDVDLQVAAWLLCILPNWPKTKAYEEYMANMAPRLLAKASVDDEVRQQAGGFFPHQVLMAEPMQISAWLARTEKRLGVDAFRPDRFKWPPFLTL